VLLVDGRVLASSGDHKQHRNARTKATGHA
jgi:hypothetical protein